MCRIAGIIDKGSPYVYTNAIKMRDSMVHGGPDGSGIYFDEEEGLALAHNRLSVIDLSQSAGQPMADEGQQIIVSFNGEIYNYKELKAQLINAGFVFKTASDTEVIIMAYKYWGCRCFSMFKGMFAIALFDRLRGELVMARDHAGIKPLYYYHDQRSLYFSSEIRGIKALGGKWQANKDWKILLLTFGFIPEPFTILNQVYALARGTYIIFNAITLRSSTHQFYEDDYNERIFNKHEAVELIRTTLSVSVRRHIVSDAPLGVFLSGGLDSSILALLAAGEMKTPLSTLSIDFKDQQFSEGHYQRLVALQCGSDHHSFLLDKDSFINSFEDILGAMDQPTADGVNTYFTAKYARQCGLKVVLSGLGADELLGGYPSFKNAHWVSKLKGINPVFVEIAKLASAGKYRKIDFLKRKDLLGEYLFCRGYFTPQETARLLNVGIKEVTEVVSKVLVPDFTGSLTTGNKISSLEQHLYMQGQLLKDTDVMGMWHGLEVRLPYLDVDFINAVHSIASGLKYTAQPKRLLTASFKGILPVAIQERRKQSFTLPFVNWMKDDKLQSLMGIQNLDITKQFMLGSLSWTRYWAYALTTIIKN